MRQMSGASDDSQRSFGMESDYYVDATIASTPGTTPVPETRPEATKPSIETWLNLEEEQPISDARAGTETSRPWTTKPGPIPLLKPRPGQRQQSPQFIEEDEESEESSDQQEEEQEEEEEEEYEEESEEQSEVRNAVIGHTNYTNTPVPKQNSQFNTQDRRLQRAGSNLPNADRPRATIEQGTTSTAPTFVQRGSTLLPRNTTSNKSRTGSKLNATRSLGLNEPLGGLNSSQDTRKNLNLNIDARQRPGLFTRNKTARQDQNVSNAVDRYPSNSSEQDEAMQRDIQEAEERIAREREAEIRRERWRQQWAWFLSLWSLDPLRTWASRQLARLQRPRASPSEGEDAPLDWGRYFSPTTYLQMLVSLIDKTMDLAVSLFDRISSLNLRAQLAGSIGAISWVVVGLFVLLMSFGISQSLLGRSSLSGDEWDFEPRPSFSSRLPTVGQITDKINSIMPSMPSMPTIPTISWPSRKTRDEFPWEFSTDSNFRSAEEYLEKYEKDLSTLKKATELHRASLKKLETVVPQIVHMEVRDGRPVVKQEFWHALRDLIKREGSFLNMEMVDNGYEVSSDDQWRGIMARLIKDPTFTSKLNMTMSDLEGRFDNKMTTFWDSWIKNNDNKIADILGPALDKIQSAGSGREFDRRFSKIVKEHLQGDDLRDTVVTRDEFLRHLKNEFASHRAEVRHELEELRPRMDELIREALRMAAENTPQSMSKSEITTLVNGLVRKSVADLNLEALAKGQIHLHWDAELKNQINYFSIGSGATIDAKRTSVTFDPHKQGAISSGKFMDGLRGSMPYPPIAALTPWSEEGDCWCAARSLSRRGNPHGATISVQLANHLIPQHVVIEHIVPGATRDPGARPKDIEIYAHIGDARIRERVEDFSRVYFPPDDQDWDETPANFGTAFVMIGRFRYEGADQLHDGVYVHRLSSELADLGAETDQVVVRATSNYGARDHTCFYRVRLFGERR